MLKNFLLLTILATGLILSGCFQAHSDDALRTIPTTNNPHIIQDSSKTAQAPSGLGY